MRPFTSLTAVAAPLPRPNIDTDVIIPITRLVGNPPDQLGPFLFEPWRYRDDGGPEPDFVLNRPRHHGAAILVAGENFGCGSSREHAVWALDGFGIRCVVAASFGDIFRQNCYQNGVVPVTLEHAEVQQLLAELGDDGLDPTMTVDLVETVIVSPAGRRIDFDFDAERREALLEGLDDIGLTLKLCDRIEAFETEAARSRPWALTQVPDHPTLPEEP